MSRWESTRLPATNELPIRVTPRSSSQRVTVLEGAVRVYVTAPPEGGKANEQAIRVLSKALGVPKTSLTLIRGSKSRDKVIDLGAITCDQALQILAGD